MGGGGWVEMVMGGSMVVGGPASDGRISGGVDLCSNLFLFLFFYFGGCDLMVDSMAIVGFFFPGDCGCKNQV